MLVSSMAHAAPSGGQITAGSGSVEQSAGAVTIDQASSRLVIDWQNFSIGAGESVRFLQPSAQAIALNRILGQDPSVILGNLSANGQVFLLNPNGVLFGAGAQVNVGGIVASTLGLSNDDFLAGRYTLQGTAGDTGVLNQGTIDAPDGGYVAFAGGRVENDGVIRARLGTVALGAGEQVTLTIDDTALVGFRVDRSTLAALASNRQLIQADGGSVILSARATDALLSSVVNNDGIIEARSIENRNGVIRLDGGSSGVVATAGVLDVSGAGVGESGGRVEVTGDKVALLAGARIDASGDTGGGVVLVGGDYQGGNAALTNASSTFVASSVSIHADAIDVGDGGRVIVWADGDTRFRGAISARGGSVGGDGGFVEVSGKQHLGFDGRVDTTAAHGEIGSLLLDPDDLYVAAAPVGGALPDVTNPFQASGGGNFYVLGTTLTALPAATAVLLQANRNIIFQTNLAMPTTGSLTLNASNAIQMAGFNLATAGGNVSMTAGAGGITNLGTINLGGGLLTLDSSGAITQNAGDVIAGTTSLLKQGSGVLTMSVANTYTGTTTVNGGGLRLSGAGRIADTSAVTVGLGATFDLNGVSDTVGSIAGAGSITLGSGRLTSGGTGLPTTFSGSINGTTGGVTKLGTGVLTLSGSNAYSGATTISRGTLRVTGGSAIGDASQVTLANVAGVSLDLTGNEAIGNLSGGGALGGNVTLNGNTLTVNQAGTTTFAGIASGSGGLIKQGAGALTLSGGNSFTGNTTINAGTLALGASNVFANTSRLVVNGGTLSMTTRSDTVAGVQLLSGSITGTSGILTSTSDYDLQAGSVSAILSGAVALTKSAGGTVTLSGANAYTGVTRIDGGTLVAASAAALGTTAAGTTIGNGATLQISNVAVGAEAIALNGSGVGGAGALIGTGNAALGGAVTLQSASTIAAPLAGNTLVLGGAINGASALTQTGAGTVTFANAVGATTPLASFASTAAATTVVNGGLMRTTGTQSYGGSLRTTGAATLQTANADISANGPVQAPGALTVVAGSGNATMINPANDFTTVSFNSAGTANIVDANALALGTSNVLALRAQTLGAGVTLSGVITATGAGDSIVLASRGNFTNNAGASALVAGGGRWVVWSTNPAADSRGGLDYAFKQYNATYGTTSIAGSGNGFLYTVAPLVTVGLTGTVTKVYDGNTGAALNPGNYTQSGAIDGDSVILNLPGSGGFADKNAGSSKTVSTSGLSIARAENGVAAVYGYQLVGTAVSGTIGTITPAALIGSITAANKIYDATAAAAIASRTLTGVISGDTVDYVGGVATFADKNAGVAESVTATGLSLAGTDADNYTVNTTAATTADIAALGITGAITAANKTYDGTMAATVATRTLSGVIAGDTVGYVGGTATFIDKNAGTGKTVTATGLTLAGADAANYTVNTTAATSADIATLAITGAITASNKIYDGDTSATIATRTLSGMIAGDTVSYVGGTAAFADKNVGSGKAVVATELSLGGTDAGNYTVNTTAATSADIATLAITGAITASNKIYDGDTSATIATRTLAGVIVGDNVSYVGGAAVFADANAAMNKTVTGSGLGLSGSDAANYSVNTTTATVAHIDQRPLTVAADAGQTKVYGDADPQPFAYSITAGTLVAGDTFSGALARIPGENVGNYSMTQNTLTAGSNYSLEFDSNAFAITPATLVYLANGVRLTQGTPLPLFTGTVEGFKRDDTQSSATTGTLAFTTTAPDSSQIGTYAIDGAGLAANLGNYVFVQTALNADALLITPSPSAVVGAIASASQTESPCAELRDADEREALCGAQMTYRQTQQVNPLPDWRRVVNIDGASFASEAGGIQLPTGAQVQ